MDSIRSCIAGGLILLAAGALVAVAAPAAAQVNVAVGDLQNDGSITIEFLVKVDDPVPAGTTQVCNQGTVSGDNFDPDVLTDDPDEAGGADPTCTPVEAAPDLTIAKSDGGASVSPGGTVAYTLTYANVGDQDATGVAISDTVPANTTFNPGASTAGWVCAPDNNAGSLCTLAVGALAGGGAGGAATFAVTVIDPVPAGVDEISNTATIADDGANGADPTPENNLSTDTTPVDAAPDLTIAKADGGVTAAPGDTVAYTLTYANDGDQDATGVTLGETVPANTTFNAGASTPGWACVPDASAGSACSLAVGALAAGGGGSADFAVTVVDPVPAGVVEITNTATIADDGTNGADPTPGDNSSTDTTPVDATPDLTIDKDDGGASVAPGGTVAYTLAYANVGDQGATGVELTETVPANTTFNAGASTPGWACVPDASAGSLCTLAVGALAGGGAGGSADFAVTVDDPLPAGVAEVTNTATVADDGTNGTDPTPGDNSSTDTTPVDAAPDLAVDKSYTGATPVPGDTVAFDLDYANNGNQGATGVVLSETVPANTTFNAGASSAGWSCADGSPAGTLCELAVGALAGAGGGGSAVFAVDLDDPLPAGVSEIENCAAIADDGANGADPNPADNDSCSTIGLSPDLAITKDDGQTEAVPGETVTYTITVTNLGPNDAVGATVEDTFPPELTGVSWTCVASAGSSCTAGPVAGDIADSVTVLEAGTVTYTVTATIDPGATGTLVNTATVTTADPDPVPGNNSATDTNTLTPMADLRITKAGADPLPAGADLTYTITVENLGPSDATGVVVNDPLPAAVTYVSDTCGGADLPPWTWNVGNLAAGASVSCDLVVSINPGPPASISNTASVAGAEPDPNAGNNSATEETTLDNVPPVVVSVAALPSGQVLTNGVLVTTSITGLEVAFSEAMQDPPGDTDPDDVTNPANYLLVRPGANGTFQTVSCAAGLAGDDVQVAIQSVTYDAGTFAATLDLGSPLPVDDYRFFACGSATLRDLAGNPLAGGDDFEVEFRMASVLEIPTLDEVGLVLLVLLLALAGLWLLGRRRGGFGPTAAAGLLAVALLGAAAAPASAQVVIDEFTTAQGPLTDPGTSSSTAATGGADILGQERDLVVIRSAGAGTVTAEVTGGELDFTAPDGTTGELLATWDGTDGDPTTLDPTGLGGVDLTDDTAAAQGGFRLVIEEATAGTYLLLTVYQDADNVSRAARVLPAIGSQTAIFIDFSELVPAPGALGPADLTDVGAITLLVGARDDDPGPSLVLSHFETAPPAVAAIKIDRTPAGDPIAGAVNPGDTIRYRVTITNPGGGALGVDFEDLVAADPNLSFVAGSVRTTPLARRDHYRTVLDTPIDSAVAALPSLLANDVDPDGDALEAVPATGQATALGGTVDIEDDGHFVYTPPAGFVGVDSFTYTIAPTAGDPTTDAAGNPVGPVVGTAQVFIDRAPPVVVAGGVLAYTENDLPTAVDPGLMVTDEDSPNLAGATAQITGNYAMGEDVLSFVDQLGITGSWDALSGTLTLSGSSSVANYQTALRSVAYENTSDDPSELTRTVTWIADDGLLQSAPATSTIEVKAVNDPPVLADAGTVTFTEGDLPVAVAPDLKVTDVDDANLESATVTITNLLDTGEELLAADTTGTSINAVYAAPTLTLTGTDTLANYQAVLQGVTYENTSVDPDETDRSVTFVVNDGEDDSNTETATVEVVAVNTPPVLTNDPISYATAGNTQLHAGGASIAGLVSIDDADNALVKSAPTDPDGPASPTVVPASGTSANGGDFDIAADGSFTYVPLAGFSGTDSFTYQVTDSEDSTLGTIEITVSEVVWYVRDVVDADNPAGGDGRSTDAFETLAGAEGDSDADHIIFVFRGGTGGTPLGGGITLKNGQKLHGEGIGLVHPTHGTLVPAGTRPHITNATVGGNGVTVLANTLNGDRTGIEIRGLEISGAANAVDATSENAANLGVRIGQNTISGAGAEGIDVNVGSTNTGQTLSLHDNTVTATGTGIDVTRTAGTLTITAFGDNSVSGTTGGSGIVVSGPSVTFDAVPGGSFDTVVGGVLAIGSSVDPVGVHGLFLNQVSGDLTYTSINVFADGGTGLRVGGTGQFTGAAGMRFRHLSPDTGVVEATGGPAVDINPTTADLRLATIRSTSSTTTGVSLVSLLDGTGTTARFSAGAGSTISGAAGTAFHVDGGNATIAYGGTITNAAGRSVVVQNRTADTATFTGSISDTGTGILLNNNTGSSNSFQGGISLSTGTSAAFTATGGGTLHVCDENPCNPAATGPLVNTLTTTTGTALNVANTTIGSNNLEFRSISSSGGSATGIILDNTGSSGGLKVKGTGTAASGGTIANKTGADGSTSTGIGIYLNQTSNVSLSNMLLRDFQNYGIRGLQVSGFTMTSTDVDVSSFATNGTTVASDEGSVSFGVSGGANGLTGTATITDSLIRRGYEDNLSIFNSSGSLNLTIDNSVIRDTGSVEGNDGVIVRAAGTANITVDVRNSDFIANRGDHFQGTADDSAVLDVRFGTNGANTLTGGHATALGQSITINSGSFSGQVIFDVSNNSINGAIDTPINVNKGGGTGTFSGTIHGNTIGTSGVANSGTTGNKDAIRAVTNGAGSYKAVISDNVIRQVSGNGIFGIARDGSSDLDLTIVGNNLSEPAPGVNAIRVESGATSSDTVDTCADIGGSTAALRNTVTGDWGAAIFADEMRLRHQFSATCTFRLPAFAGGTTTDVVNYLTARNSVTGTISATIAGGGSYTGGAACAQP